MGFFGAFITVVGLFSAPSAQATGLKATQIGMLPIYSPAFLTFLGGGSDEGAELLVSSFSMFGGTRVSRVNLSTLDHKPLSNKDIQTVNKSLIWPNEASVAPEAIFGPHFIVVSTGFLVPGRSTGGIAFVDVNNGESFEITTPKKGWFYHRTHFEDLNGDGLLDVITARGTKPIIGQGQGELLWLEQPAGNKNGPWQEHIIAQGPDVYFRMLDLDGDGSKEIIAAEFFSKKLSVHWREGTTWMSRPVDDAIGAVFDLIATDLNLDGRLDIVVTNHEGKDRGAIYAYEIPENFKTATWQRRTLLSGIKTELRGINQASPGTPLVWPTRHGKPHIFIAGDGSTKVHWLAPKSESPQDWNYESKILLDTDSTIGSMAMGDANGDGTSELFVPAYDKSQIFIFRMNET